MESFLQDIRYGLRQLRRAPGFALIAVLSLAVGIGAPTAVFSIVYASLINPYPFRDWQRLVTLTVLDKSGAPRQVRINGEQLSQLRAASVIDDVVAMDFASLSTTGNVGSDDLPEDVSVMMWTTNAGEFLGVPPLMGRAFNSADAPEGQEPQPVAMLGAQFWRRHYGSDQNIVGQTIELAHVKYRIVGVMSPKVNGGQNDVYLPLKVTRDPASRWGTFVRVKPGVTPEAASQALQPLLEEFARATPANYPQGFRAHILPLSYGTRTGLGPSLYLLFGAVCLLLLIGCLNVAILLLARGTRRKYELAVRAALGAARVRVLRQLITEALLIALVGEALGIGLAFGLQKLLVQQLPLYLAVRAWNIHINLPVLAFSIAATLLTVLLFGLLPAVQLSRRDLRTTMQLGTGKITGGWGRHTRNALIAGQVALSLVLLAASATSLRAFIGLLHAPLGYEPKNVLFMAVPLHVGSYTTWEARATFFRRLEEKIASTPDVVGATFGDAPPDSGTAMPFEILGQTTLGDQEAWTNFVSPDYFRVLQTPLLQGRVFDRAELARGARVAVVNQTMAHQFFPNGNVLGRQIKLSRLQGLFRGQLTAPGADDWLEIVGVTADALNNGLRNPVQPAVYVPYTLSMPTFAEILVRTRGNPLAMLHTLRQQVQQVDSEQQVMRNAKDLEQWIMDTDDWQREHLVALLFGAFSVLTLLLAGIGLYSVVSYSVAQRTSEFALRMALGAQRSDVLRSVVFSILGVMAVGGAAGVALHFAVSRVVSQWAYAGGRDPFIILLVAPLLLLVALAACYVPARRAMTLDPMQALRYE